MRECLSSGLRWFGINREETVFFGSLFGRTSPKARQYGGLLLFDTLLSLCEASGDSFFRVPGGRLPRGKRQRLRSVSSS